MGLKTKEFEIFYIKYKTVSFPAARGFEVMRDIADISPLELLENTLVFNKNRWTRLNTRAAVNKFVVDKIGKIPPLNVLTGLVDVVTDHNFGFLTNWKGAKIPARFTDGPKAIASLNVEPMIAQLTADGTATMRELEEYYSLEDAFKLFDITVVKGINQALSNEAATKPK